MPAAYITGVLHVMPIGDMVEHFPNSACECLPIETEPGIVVHHAKDCREAQERQGRKTGKNWEVVEEDPTQVPHWFMQSPGPHTPRDYARIAYAAQIFHAAKLELVRLGSHYFPRGTAVSVCCPRYNGYGFVVLSDSVQADQLAVILENGNVWHYPIACCRRVSLSEVPGSNRRSYLRHRGINVL